MKNFKINFFIKLLSVVFFTISFISCSKKNENKPKEMQTDVYVVGNETKAGLFTRAKMWKNGEPTNLTDGSQDARAQSIFVTQTEK